MTVATMKSSIKIFVVDDHPVVRDGLKLLLELENDLQVCGLAENARKAMKEISTEKPDLTIVDISLKGTINGIELTKALKNRYPKMPILVLSMHDESIYAERAIRAGAKGYIMKHEMTGAIVTAIRSILEGKLYLSENMTSKFLEKVMNINGNKFKSPLDGLTNRELEVFQLIGEGVRTRDIAAKLNLSIKTIDTYRLRIKTKLNIDNSTELTKTAIEWNHDN